MSDCVEACLDRTAVNLLAGKCQSRDMSLQGYAQSRNLTDIDCPLNEPSIIGAMQLIDPADPSCDRVASPTAVFRGARQLSRYDGRS